MSGLEANSIAGPAGPLETLWQPAIESATCALLCHPHPQYGGNLHDGVLGVAAQALDEAGVAHLRFNFRGVGASAGVFDNGTGEQDDVLAAWRWLGEQGNWSRQILVGYSFGSAMAWAARRNIHDISQLILIAPPTGAMAFAGSCDDVDCHIIVGSNDSYCDQQSLPDGAELTLIEDGDHFFSGVVQELHSAVTSALGAPEAT